MLVTKHLSPMTKGHIDVGDGGYCQKLFFMMMNNRRFRYDILGLFTMASPTYQRCRRDQTIVLNNTLAKTEFSSRQPQHCFVCH